MEHIDTLISARWVIPIEPGGCVLEDHALAIHHGRIVALLPANEAKQRFAAAETVERPGHVLLPGLVNASTRGAMTLLRGAAESSSLQEWSRQIRLAEQRWVDAEYVRDGTELAIAEMLTSGTTCFADVHLFPEVVAQTASALRMRACVGLPVLDTPTVWAGSADECLQKGLGLHDEYRDDPLIATALAPRVPQAVGDETLERVRRNADELELPVMVAVMQRPTDGGERTLARIERLGLLSPLLLAVHALGLDEGEIDRLGRVGASVAHCPQANLKLGLGVSAVASMKARGANIAIATDTAASNNDLDLLDETRTAALLSRGLFPDAPPLSSHDWLTFATLGGARALGLSEAIGSLAPGKWADVCCIDLRRPHTQPVYDAAAQVVFAASRDQVRDVWVAGRALVRDGRLTAIDIENVLARAAQWRDRIAQPLATSA